METKFNFNVTKKDIFNAKTASISVKDVLNETLTATGCFVAVNEGIRKGTGETCDIGYISTNRGVIGFSSEVAISAIEAFSEYLADVNEPVEIKFTEHAGKNGNYYTFEIV